MMQNNKPFLVGITGGIGSGKSEVSKYIISLGYPLIDADLIAREVVMPGEIGLIRIVETYGDSILNEDKSLNRRKLGEIVFNNKILLEQLNAILHPLIHMRIQQYIQMYQNHPIIFIDVPLLFETDSRKNYDEVILVFAPKAICIERIVNRDKISQELAIQKINAQMDPELKRSLSDYEICNNKDISTLHRQVDFYLNSVTKRTQSNRNI